MTWNPYSKYGVMSDWTPYKEEDRPTEASVVSNDFLENISIVRELHEENIGKKLTDDQFRSIIESLVSRFPDALSRLQDLNDSILGALIALDDVTNGV